MRITSGDLDVLHNGTVIGYGNNPVEFHLGADNDPLVIRLVFNDSPPEGKKDSTDFQVINPKLGVFTFHGYRAPLGFGSTEALHIGTLNKRKLYFSYRIYTLAERPERMIAYTFHLGEAVQNG